MVPIPLCYKVPTLKIVFVDLVSQPVGEWDNQTCARIGLTGELFMLTIRVRAVLAARFTYLSRAARRRSRVHFTILLLLLAAVIICLQGSATAQDRPPLTPQQIRALVLRATANQHKNDAALDAYERTERVITRERDGRMHDVLSRVVPHGDTGNLHVELERDGMPTASATLAAQWSGVAAALAGYSHSDDPRFRLDREKAAKRDAERTEMEDAINSAFIFHWIGRKTEGDRNLVELSFDPDPAYKPTGHFTSIYQHIRGTVWIDESNAQLVKVDAGLFEDVSFVGGIVAKLYQGATCHIEQSEAAPGVWFPAHYGIQLDGRKFLVGSLSIHQVVDVSGYRRVGPPQEALAIIRSDPPGAQ